MATELDAFLASEAGDNTPPPPPTPPTEAAPAAPEPKPEPKAEPAAKATPEPAEDDGDPPTALEGEPVIPRRAYEDERRKRQDWKEQAVRNKERAEQLERQLEEAKRAPPPPPQPVYRAPPPDPTTDPQGYQQYAHQQKLEEKINDNLNYSEWLLSDKIGEDKVSELKAEFMRMAEQDQTLFQKMYSQPHPYRWMQQQVERHRAMAEIGDDPAQFRAKVEAEARARWEQERQALPVPAPVSPAASMQPSLATARSVAGRTTPGWTGEPSLDDVVSQIQNRKRTNGSTAPRF